MDKTPLHSLIPLADFKAILGIDDREDALSRYCLITATYTIEQYCHRRLLKKRRFEFPTFVGEYEFPLKDYPVREILAVYRIHPLTQSELVEPEFYHTVPDCGDLDDIPFFLSVSPTLKLVRGISGLKIYYWAGYRQAEVPADLSSACLELAAWNMSRYRGRRIGMTGAVRGQSGLKADGEHLEPSMPENVKALLEPYRRRLI
ncbi:hypothetical protein TREPR_2184 [Treponema primitia ZAS-2]|uniref:Phage gp6-like head-tail connector protein n=1 Tax=Treponema primitia (strain ATCC BAA-887 / DSM 12427 / ZAS-2) TaxID=545694 RepID=F5YJ20_TREPZ|nr:hypothetical protein [Treponema primitia]AEF83750.1 hypothetical protein TREPR_2184 [Treponema primitia ZAS-2]